MTFSLSSESTQPILYEQPIESKKRSFDDESDGYDQYVFFDEPVNKKVIMRWSKQENLKLAQILNDSFAKNTMTSMNKHKWEDLTEKFNAETNTIRTKKQVYNKVTNMLIRGNNPLNTFKDLLEKQTINKKTKHQKVTTNPTTTSLSSETQTASNNLQTPSSTLETIPLSDYQKMITHKLSILSRAFYKGYLEGIKKYAEEKEKNGNNIPNIRLLSFNTLDMYNLELPRQFSYLGYNCAINRLTGADTKNVNIDTLYPSHLTTSFIGLSCYSKSKEDAKNRISNQIQDLINKGLDPKTPISMPFTNIDCESQNSVNSLFYKILSNNCTHNFNKRRKREKIDQLYKDWVGIYTSSDGDTSTPHKRTDLDISSLNWDLT
jgi:hypothetical protein